jgi:hypothetical protein
MDNVKTEEQASFSIISPEYLSTQGLSYDYASIMHFSGNVGTPCSILPEF